MSRQVGHSVLEGSFFASVPSHWKIVLIQIITLSTLLLSIHSALKSHKSNLSFVVSTIHWIPCLLVLVEFRPWLCVGRWARCLTSEIVNVRDLNISEVLDMTHSSWKLSFRKLYLYSFFNFSVCFFSVCRDFAVLEDHCLAYNLQEQESKKPSAHMFLL